MCRSSVTLFYGLWVKSWSLAFAADAFDKIHPTLLGIDLIARRWREGKLQAEEQDQMTTARDLPGEVWELIKQEVIDEAVLDEEAEQLKAHCLCLRCRHAHGWITNEELKQGPPPARTRKEEDPIWTSWDDMQCGECFTAKLRTGEEYNWFESEAAQAVRRFSRLVCLYR